MARNMDDEGVALWRTFGKWLKSYLKDIPEDEASLAMAGKTVSCMMREMVAPDLLVTADSTEERLAWLNSVRSPGGVTLYQVLQGIRLANKPHAFTAGADDYFCGLCNESAGGDRHRREIKKSSAA